MLIRLNQSLTRSAPLWVLVSSILFGQETLTLPAGTLEGESAAGMIVEELPESQRPEYPTVDTELFSSELTEVQSTSAVQVSRARPRASFRSRLYSAMSEALCDCDECYEPQWRLVESASFWVDAARPQNRTRLRYDYGSGLILPDRAEYFWAKVGGRGPSNQPGSLTVDSLDYHEMSMYAETAHGNFSAFIVTPYRSLYMEEAGHAAGFADLQIGTKSLLHDTPMFQVAMQMTTTIPSANSREGLGTGHVSLEPALLIGLALTERDSLQAQVAQWIPLGGDPDYQGALLRWGVAWNRVMWMRDQGNVATMNLDLIGWSFQDGAYTDPFLGPQRANDETYLYLGPGARWLFCGKFEFGLGGIIALSDRHFAENVVRTELTLRY
jgi:hypothetical protein